MNDVFIPSDRRVTKIFVSRLKNNRYKVRFPNLTTPVEMNQQFFDRIQQNEDYAIHYTGDS